MIIRYDSTKTPAESLKLLKDTLVKNNSERCDQEFLWCVNDTDLSGTDNQQRALVYQLYRAHIQHEVEWFATDMQNRNRLDMYEKCIALLRAQESMELDAFIDAFIRLRRLFTSTQMNLRAKVV